jgi:hypothetical protein
MHLDFESEQTYGEVSSDSFLHSDLNRLVQHEMNHT